ncbi:hypothetical protein CIHG_05455 [Coccidioides immitis H538.4]|uniref:Uncharacterized protein n=1 Tax=Coccidioides immitis H538.4 TaxID=396776 RepID=A0A0J8UJP5_COCIT|nr:hypothetical protein CIHG_05455 [Coccidioides immitis H538.4]
MGLRPEYNGQTNSSGSAHYFSLDFIRNTKYALHSPLSTLSSILWAFCARYLLVKTEQLSNRRVPPRSRDTDSGLRCEIPGAYIDRQAYIDTAEMTSFITSPRQRPSGIGTMIENPTSLLLKLFSFISSQVLQTNLP